jgi:type II secretory pathway component PulF
LIFAGFNAQLPLLTRAIIAVSGYVKEYGPFIVIAIALLVYGAQQWLSTEAGRRQWQAWLLKLPMIGPLAARLAMTRFCRMLGTLTGSGVTLITALRVAQESLGNQVLIDALGETIDRVQPGQRWRSCRIARSFSADGRRDFSVAKSRARSKGTAAAGDVTERELDGRLRVAVSLTEPLMLFVLAAIIGTSFHRGW